MVVIPSKRRSSRRGFDSHRVHQKAYWTVNIVKRTLGVGVASMLPNGPDQVSIGLDSKDGNSAKQKPQDWGNPVGEAKK